MEKHKGDRAKVATELGISAAAVSSRINVIRRRLPDVTVPAAPKERPYQRVTEEQKTEVEELVARYGSVRAAATATGIPRATLQNRYQAAQTAPVAFAGRDRVPKPRTMPKPAKGDVARYILTCAQSGTRLHDPTWNALHALAGYHNATVMVSTFSYNHRLEGSAKRGTEHANADWYDERIEEYVCDEAVALAPSLIWNGNLNILPTAVDPLSGLDNYNGRASSVFPHAKVAMKSVHAFGGDAKLQYTTGACTKLNYIQKKAGQKAEFDHVFGALLVEVDHTGAWWARQLHVDGKGELRDLDILVHADGSVSHGHAVEALVFGDVHVAQLDPVHQAAVWGSQGMVEALRPAVQVMHDVLDMESRGHHTRRDPHEMYARHVRDAESVTQEIADVVAFLRLAAHHGPVTVVNSNHDRALARWLKEADWRTDPVNAEFYLDAQRAYLRAIRVGKTFDALAWACGHLGGGRLRGVTFLPAGDSHVVCRRYGGGVELGLHGDLGPGGSRGSIRNLSRLGRKVVIGHSHTAGIFGGAYQVGVTARLGMDYVRGTPSAWTHTDCVVHVNGKRQLLTWHKGRWRA